MTECGCVYSSYDGDGPEFPEVVTTPKARKRHKCYECGDPIEIGSPYQKVIGKWDGDFHEYKTCLPCVEIRESLFCDGWVYGAMWADIEEGLFPQFKTGCFDKLQTARAKEKLAQRFREYLEVE